MNSQALNEGISKLESLTKVFVTVIFFGLSVFASIPFLMPFFGAEASGNEPSSLTLTVYTGAALLLAASALIISRFLLADEALSKLLAVPRSVADVRYQITAAERGVLKLDIDVESMPERDLRIFSVLHSRWEVSLLVVSLFQAIGLCGLLVVIDSSRGDLMLPFAAAASILTLTNLPSPRSLAERLTRLSAGNSVHEDVAVTGTA